MVFRALPKVTRRHILCDGTLGTLGITVDDINGHYP